MMKKYLTILLLFFVNFLYSQKVTKIVFIGEKGIVKDYKEAKSFIVMKKFPDGSFQRLNYKKRGPLESLQTYGDGTLSFFEGRYYSYTNGNLNCMGYYNQNKKDSTWYYYDDTLKLIRKEIYSAGELIKTVDPDTVNQKSVELTGIISTEKVATFPGGPNAWSKYLDKVFYKKTVETFDDNVITKSANGGKVKIHFTISETGDVEDIYLLKSVEYILDEELYRIIKDAPAWIPAERNGVKIKSHRRQSLDFVKDGAD